MGISPRIRYNKGIARLYHSGNKGGYALAQIIQRNIFTWQAVYELGDLERLQLVIDAIPDDGLMKVLEDKRKGKRDDYPVRAVWNSVLAGIVYQHESIESLRRELSRNGQLRDVCGFDPNLGINAVPTKDAYHRFLKNLISVQEEIDKIFEGLVEELKRLLPDFGKHLAIDGKEIKTHRKKTDREADWGIKRYKGEREDGTLWEKIKKWFGYKLHLVVDSAYELPVSYKITKASESDTKELIPMMKAIKGIHPEIIARAGELSADKGYDSTENITVLWDEYGIKPVIDIRDTWKEGKKGEIITHPLYPEKTDNIVYDIKGKVYCHCPVTDERREMAYCGFEKDRGVLKYRCPAKAYGIGCKGQEECSPNRYGKIVRIPLATDRRIFTPVARSSYAWETAYNKRTAVERVNSRIDNVYGFEKHYIFGKFKMTLRISLALIVMLSMAVGRIRQGQEEEMRSLIAMPLAA